MWGPGLWERLELHTGRTPRSANRLPSAHTHPGPGCPEAAGVWALGLHPSPVLATGAPDAGRQAARMQAASGVGEPREQPRVATHVPSPGPRSDTPSPVAAPLGPSAEALPGVGPDPVQPTLRFLPETKM